jgi:hypothetical protein
MADFISLPNDMFALVGEKMDYQSIKSLGHVSPEFATRVKELHKEHALSIAPPVKDYMYYHTKAGTNVAQMVKHLQKDGIDVYKYAELLFGKGYNVQALKKANGDLLLAILLSVNKGHLSELTDHRLRVKKQIEAIALKHNKGTLFKAGERLRMFKNVWVYDPAEDDS